MLLSFFCPNAKPPGCAPVFSTPASVGRRNGHPGAPAVWARAILALLALVCGSGGAARAQGSRDQPEQTIQRPLRKQKPPPVNMVVQVGHDEFTRKERITPVRVTLDQNEQPVKGHLELRDTAGNVTRMPVELPRKGRKEFTLFATLTPDMVSTKASSGEILLFDGRRLLLRQNLSPRYPDEGTATLLVLSCTGDGSGLQFLNEQRSYQYLDPGKYFKAAHASPQDLPRQWPGYEPLDVVVLNGRAWNLMDDEQKRAFRIWVERGGRAILCGEVTTEWRDGEAQALAPLVPQDLYSAPRLQALAAWGKAPYQAGSGTLLTVSGPVDPDSDVLLAEGNRPLVVRREALAGQVLWIGFDPFRQTVRDWQGYPLFWREAMEAVRRRPGQAGLQPLESVPEARAAAGALPRLPVPPMPAIIGFGVLYAFVFGPLNIWMLRRLRRTVRSWLFVPSLAVGMTLVVLILGQMWGNARTVLNSYSVLHATSGGRTAHEQNLTGLFSPTNRAFDLTVEDPAPQLRAQRDDGSSTNPLDDPLHPLDWPDYQDEGTVKWEAVALQLFSVRLLEEMRPCDLGGSIDVLLSPQRSGGKTGGAQGRSGLSGTVRNGTGLPLQRAYLRQGQRVCWLGNLDAGARVAVKPGAWSRELPRREGPLPSGELLENQRFRENVEAVWARAPELLVPPRRRKDVWLVAECPGYRSGLEIAAVPYTNRSGLLLVHVP